VVERSPSLLKRAWRKAAKAQARVQPALGRIILSICIGDQANCGRLSLASQKDYARSGRQG
jgi:hypothetical protein